MVDPQSLLSKRDNTCTCSHGVNTERVGRVTSGHVNLGSCARSDARDGSNWWEDVDEWCGCHSSFVRFN